MTQPHTLIARLQHFVLADDYLEIRRKERWGVRPQTAITRALDLIEHRQRDGIQAHRRKDYPLLTDRMLYGLAEIGYLRPAE